MKKKEKEMIKMQKSKRSVPVCARIDVRFLAEAHRYLEESGIYVETQTDIIVRALLKLFEKESLVPRLSVEESVSYLKEHISSRRGNRWKAYLDAVSSESSQSELKSELSSEKASEILDEITNKSGRSPQGGENNDNS